MASLRPGGVNRFASFARKTATRKGSWLNFKPIVDTISGGFNWLKDNPEFASGLGWCGWCGSWLFAKS